MNAMDRDDRIRREKGKGVLRALHATELEAAGAERVEGLRRADEQLDRIARVLPEALHGGLTVTEVARLTGVSRPTLYQLLARYSDVPRDLRLAVMQGLMTYKTSFPEALADHLKRTPAEIEPIIQEFVASGWIEWDVDNRQPRRDADLEDASAFADDDDLETPLSVTPEGYEALERWKFENDESDDEGMAGS